ncbi:hypothetical protein [Streptomyces sp. NRRL B-1140]|uniref:hypothetical protein n=1 Tax=Streptomyces sp. NRRL B-1140 TaxID=1415549 RepID=UPI0006AE58F5
MATTTGTREFTLPDLGEGLTEAEIVRWLGAEGDGGREPRLGRPLLSIGAPPAPSTLRPGRTGPGRDRCR